MRLRIWIWLPAVTCSGQEEVWKFAGLRGVTDTFDHYVGFQIVKRLAWRIVAALKIKGLTPGTELTDYEQQLLEGALSPRLNTQELSYLFRDLSEYRSAVRTGHTFHQARVGFDIGLRLATRERYDLLLGREGAPAAARELENAESPRIAMEDLLRKYRKSPRNKTEWVPYIKMAIAAYWKHYIKYAVQPWLSNTVLTLMLQCDAVTMQVKKELKESQKAKLADDDYRVLRSKLSKKERGNLNVYLVWKEAGPAFSQLSMAIDMAREVLCGKDNELKSEVCSKVDAAYTTAASLIFISEGSNGDGMLNKAHRYVFEAGDAVWVAVYAKFGRR